MSSAALAVGAPQAPASVFVDDAVTNFMDHRLAESHPKFQNVQDKAAAYDLARGKYDSDGQAAAPGSQVLSDTQVQARNQSLEDAIKTFTASQASMTQPFESLKRATWEDVLAEISRAQDEYAAKGDRDKSIAQSLRGRLRSFDRFADKFEPWLQLLPSDSWQGSLVCGGIKVVLQVGILPPRPDA